MSDIADFRDFRVNNFHLFNISVNTSKVFKLLTKLSFSVAFKNSEECIFYLIDLFHQIPPKVG